MADSSTQDRYKAIIGKAFSDKNFAWLTGNSSGFRTICQLAGENPDEIATEAERVKANPKAETKWKEVKPKIEPIVEAKLKPGDAWRAHRNASYKKREFAMALAKIEAKKVSPPVAPQQTLIISGPTVAAPVRPVRRAKVQKVAKVKAPKPPKPQAEPRAYAKRYEHDGKSHTLKEWAFITGLEYGCLRSRIRRKVAIADALTAPSQSGTALTPERARKRKVALYNYKGEELSLNEISNRVGMKRDTLDNRLRSGWTIEQATGQAVRPRRPDRKPRREAKRYEHDGRSLTIKEWAEVYGLHYVTLRGRLSRNLTLAEALATPIQMGKPLKPENSKRQLRRYHYKGEHLTVTDIAERFGIHKSTFLNRLIAGATVEQAIEQPVAHKRPKQKCEGRGVVVDFSKSSGTGGGTIAQDGPEIAFSYQGLTEDHKS